MIRQSMDPVRMLRWVFAAAALSWVASSFYWLAGLVRFV